MARFTPSRNVRSAFLYLLWPTLWLAENIGMNSSWFAANFQKPIEAFLWPGALYFMAALFIYDLFDPKSWIKQLRRKLTDKFVITHLGTNYEDSPRRLQVVANIKFVQNVSRGELILRIRTLPKHNSITRVVRLAPLENVLKDETRKVVLLKRMVRYPGWTPYHSTWGDQPPNVDLTAPSLGPGSRNVCYLELVGCGFQKPYKIYIADLKYVSPSDMPAIYVQSEDEDIFSLST